MFERFATDARVVVMGAAREEAASAGRGRIGCEHLLLGVLAVPGPAADALAGAGVEITGLRRLVMPAPADQADPLDADALASVGIDLDAVRRAAEASFGPGALDRPYPARLSRGMRLTPDARQALQRTVVSVRALGQRRITSGHLLVGIIDQGSNPALDLLTRAGVSTAALRADLLRRLAAAA